MKRFMLKLLLTATAIGVLVACSDGDEGKLPISADIVAYSPGDNSSEVILFVASWPESKATASVVDEDETQIVIEVVIEEPEEITEDLGVEIEVQLNLDEPLSNRTLVDTEGGVIEIRDGPTPTEPDQTP